MKSFPIIPVALAAFHCWVFGATAAAGAEPGALGLFERHQDIGHCGQPGSLLYNAATRAYAVAGGGENMWFTNDAFHFVWKRMSGDLWLSANISFSGSGGNAHRKACLLVRQGLEPDSAYADAALHGNGLTSLQYRELPGARTYEIQANVSAPRGLRIEKAGGYISLSISTNGQTWQPAGGAFRLALQNPFYVGLGVCAHDNKVLETATFSEVQLSPITPDGTAPRLFSTLETMAIASKDRLNQRYTRPHPGPLPLERENRSPRCSRADNWSGWVVFNATRNNAAAA